MEKTTQEVMLKKEKAEREADFIAEEKTIREGDMQEIKAKLDKFEPM